MDCVVMSGRGHLDPDFSCERQSDRFDLRRSAWERLPEKGSTLAASHSCGPLSVPTIYREGGDLLD